jgi:hypothetical protein
MTERLNIRRMQMPEQREPAAGFDPMRDINPREWQHLHSCVDSHRGNEDFWTTNARGSRWNHGQYFRECAGLMRVLNPEVTFSLSEKEKQVYIKKHRQIISLQITFGVCNYFFPEQFHQQIKDPDYKRKIYDESSRWPQHFKEKVRTEGKTNWKDYLEASAEVKTAFPEWRSNLTESEWQELYEETITKMRSSPSSLAENAMHIRLLDTDRTPEISRENWSAMREQLREYISKPQRSNTSGSGYEHGALKLAFSMAVLSADKIINNERGLHLIMPSKRINDVPPTPQTLEI